MNDYEINHKFNNFKWHNFVNDCSKLFVFSNIVSGTLFYSCSKFHYFTAIICKNKISRDRLLNFIKSLRISVDTTLLNIELGLLYSEAWLVIATSTTVVNFTALSAKT